MEGEIIKSSGGSGRGGQPSLAAFNQGSNQQLDHGLHGSVNAFAGGVVHATHEIRRGLRRWGTSNPHPLAPAVNKMIV